MPKRILQRIYNLLLPYQRRERVDIQPALLILSSACGKPNGKAVAVAVGNPPAALSHRRASMFKTFNK